MKKLNVLEFAALLGIGLLSLSVSACKNPTVPDPEPPATIASIGWIAESIDSTYWTGNIPTTHLFYTFWLKYSGTLTAADIESARMYLPGGQTWWTFDTSDGLDTTNKVISGYRFNWSNNANQLPLGNLKAEIKFTNGTSTSLEMTTNQPGAIGNGSFTSVASQDVTSPGSTTAVAPTRPVVTSCTNDGTNMNITFNLTNLTNIHNGFVWFYDASRNYLGGFFYFLNKDTGAIYTGLNTLTGVGQALKVGANTLTIPLTDITPGSGQTAASVMTAQHCFVLVLDGSQYVSRGAGHYADYDYRSISNYY